MNWTVNKMKKKYRIRKGSIADIVIRNKKGLVMIAVASIILAGMSAATLAFACEVPEEQPEDPVAVSCATPCEEVQPEPELVSLGEYTITHYCKENYPHICNDGDATQTATGTVPTAGRTIAVDPSVIPYGAEVVIDGHVYVAEDCGGAIKGNRIDIVVDTHEEALQLGKYTTEVFVKGGAEYVQN